MGYRVELKYCKTSTNMHMYIDVFEFRAYSWYLPEANVFNFKERKEHTVRIGRPKECIGEDFLS